MSEKFAYLPVKNYQDGAVKAEVSRLKMNHLMEITTKIF
jgi:hypothetical protein